VPPTTVTDAGAPAVLVNAKLGAAAMPAVDAVTAHAPVVVFAVGRTEAWPAALVMPKGNGVVPEAPLEGSAKST
jgi:hypothetical protein